MVSNTICGNLKQNAHQKVKIVKRTDFINFTVFSTSQLVCLQIQIKPGTKTTQFRTCFS